MAKKIEKILTVDVECTCWNSEPPSGESSEIIQIGMTEVLLDELKIGKTYGWYVKPKFSTISKYCTDLTGISQGTLKGKGTFPDVCNLMIKTGTRKHTWASYGNGDLKQFQIDFERWKKSYLALDEAKKFDYPFGENYFDIGNFMSVVCGERVGLLKALEIIGEEFQGQHHSATYDSANTAKILIWILKNLRSKTF